MSKDKWLLALLILLKFVLQFFVIHSDYQLHRDEYLHIDQGYHLAWGYTSVPPLTSWFSWAIIHLGKTVFWVKFFPALFGALTIIVVWKTVEMLKGGLYARVLAAFALLFSGLVRLNILYQPNSFDIFIWTLCLFLVLKYIENKQNKWLYLIALAFAFGFLNKYNIIFLFIGLFPAILISEYRTLFTKRAFYFALLLAILLISPNLIWQAQHNFPVVKHMQELKNTQLVNQSSVGFIKEQFLIFIGSIYVLFAGFYSLVFFQNFKKFRFLMMFLAITLVVFVVLHAKGYYAFGIYPIFFAFGAVFFENIIHNKVLRYATVLLPFLLFLPISKVGLPIYGTDDIQKIVPKYKKLGMLRWEDGNEHSLPQDFADMLGWKEMAILVDSAMKKVPKSEHTLILCDNYGQAGAINFYSKSNLKAVAFNADYLNWFELDKKIDNVILVQESSDSDKARSRERGWFQRIEKIGAVQEEFAREKGTAVYVLYHAKIDLNLFLEKELESEK